MEETDVSTAIEKAAYHATLADASIHTDPATKAIAFALTAIYEQMVTMNEHLALISDYLGMDYQRIE